MSPARLSRRDFLRAGAAAAAWAASGRTGLSAIRVRGGAAGRRRLIVLGIDGLDPGLVSRWMAEGKLPALARLAARGGFRPLLTSIPPQSPVAWSNFIAGTDPGGHAIFDFIHRDPKTYLPVFSASVSEEAKRTLRLGRLVLPLRSGEIRNLRRGRAFWQILEDYGVPAVVFKMPANYPPVPTRQRTLSGMGTPDIYGRYSTFHYFTTETLGIREDIGGGEVHQVYVIGDRIEAKLPGPSNAFRLGRPATSVDLKILLDPRNPVAKIVLPGREILLRQGEWSGWVPIRFPMIPTRSVGGICRFLLKEIRPAFKLYVSSLHVDPADPALPISTPPSYAEELARRFGPFNTKGLPADTSALDNGVLDDGEFLDQDEQILAESREMFAYELGRFSSGLLFFYLSSTDQRQHMFWRHLDPRHPAHDPALAARFGGVIETTYRQADEFVDLALARADGETDVLVLSDHGFNPHYRSFNVNTWLLQNGYHRFRNEFKREDLEIGFPSTDWSRTRAYGIGLNSLYINERGREAEGIVAPGADKDNLVREIARRLEDFVDPATGERVVLRAYVAKDVYHGAFAAEAPDLVLGFNRGYRISFWSPLGRVPREVLEDNRQKWSGDHMGAAEILPGVLFASRPIRAPAPSLYDVTASVLDLLGAAPDTNMIGRSVF